MGLSAPVPVDLRAMPCPGTELTRLSPFVAFTYPLPSVTPALGMGVLRAAASLPSLATAVSTLLFPFDSL